MTKAKLVQAEQVTPTDLPAVGTQGIFLDSADGKLKRINSAGTVKDLEGAAIPLSHAASHKHGGEDEVAVATSAANAIPKSGAGSKLDIGWLPLGTTSTTVCVGNDSRLSDARTPTSHTHATTDVTSGTLPVARGGTNADLSATGGTGQVLRQSTVGGAVTVSVLAAADIPSLDTGKLTTGTLPLARGGTGGTDATTARTSLGAAATSHTHATADITSGTLSDSLLSTNVPLLNGTNTFTGTNTIPLEDGSNALMRGSGAMAPMYHFTEIPSSPFTWDTTTFGGTPTTAIPLSSFLRIVGTSSLGYFCYQSLNMTGKTTVTVTARITLASSASYIGVRIDDGTNSNYCHTLVEPGTTGLRLRTQHTGQSDVISFDNTYPQWIDIYMYKVTNGGFRSRILYSNGLLTYNLVDATYVAWTPSRAGFIVKPSGTDSAHFTYIDWLNISIT
jgi:hypothetical protein